jgi:hypothetical protein
MTDNSQYLFGIPHQQLPTYRAAEPVGDKPVVSHTGINFELLDEIMEFIRNHPKTWVQDSWYKYVDPNTGIATVDVKTEEVEDANACGTSFCFAGHAAIHEGFPLPPKEYGAEWDRLVIDGTEHYYEEASDFARERLGLTYGQSDALFDGENTMEDLELIVSVLHAYPNIKGYKLEEVRDYKYSLEDVKNAIEDDPSWLSTDRDNDW